MNGKGLKSNGVGEVSSIKAAEKEVKKSRRYLLLLGAAGGGAALVYLKPKVKERGEMRVCVILVVFLWYYWHSFVLKGQRKNDRGLRYLAFF